MRSKSRVESFGLSWCITKISPRSRTSSTDIPESREEIDERLLGWGSDFSQIDADFSDISLFLE
jgi:hypothetical protein